MVTSEETELDLVIGNFDVTVLVEYEYMAGRTSLSYFEEDDPPEVEIDHVTILDVWNVDGDNYSNDLIRRWGFLLYKAIDRELKSDEVYEALLWAAERD